MLSANFSTVIFETAFAKMCANGVTRAWTVLPGSGHTRTSGSRYNPSLSEPFARVAVDVMGSLPQAVEGNKYFFEFIE